MLLENTGTTLLERESALTSLAEYAAEAERGEGRLVLVAGEAGIGKSALVEQLHDDLPDARWSWGGCDGLFTPRPLGPLYDLAGQLGGDLLDLCRASAARDELFDALLHQLGRPGLDVVVIEDAHWADEATVDLLRFLGRRLRNCNLLLIITYREDGLSATDPLRLALGELSTQRCTRRIGLAPLSADAVAVLAHGSGLDPVELYRLAGGNPFYVTEVVRAGMGAVPASARDAVLARAARLSDQARELLDVAASAGARIELSLLAPSPPAAVDELVASGLLVGDEAGLAFRHEIGRLAIEEGIAAHRRRAIHGRILDALRGIGSDDDARLAFHAEAAGDTEAVMRYAPAAAHRAVELASHREAAAQFERALRFATDTGPATLAALHQGLAYELSLLDRWPESAEAGERALALWRAAGDRLREGDVLRRLSRAMWRLCRGREALANAEAAVTTLEPLGPTAELAWAYANLANQLMADGAYDAAITLARRARASAEPLGVFAVISDALNTESCCIALADNQDGDWVALLRRALEVAVTRRNADQAGRAYANLQMLLGERRRFAAADRYFVEGLAYCREYELGTFANCLRGEQTNTLEKTGRWEESSALSAELLRLVASPINRINPLLSLGKIRARRQEPGAWDCLDEAASAADGSGEPGWIASARLARAEAHWLEGKLDRARREAELADDVGSGCGHWLRGASGAWLIRTGSARTIHGESAGPYRLESAGDWAGAARAWAALGCPYDAALALLAAPEEVALRRALQAFQDLGAAATARITRQRMRQLGLRSIPAGPRTTTRAHPLKLTRREHEVLDLICAGHTNAEIADRLFISAKTVDHHVSAVLAKLDAPTRTVAADRAARLGLVAATDR